MRRLESRAMTSFTRPLGYIVFVYWFVFWLLNGMDKFMHGAGVSLGGAPLFIWYGKDRTTQFTGYFERLGLPQDGIPLLLGTCGVMELAVAVLFVVAIVSTRSFEQWAGAAFTACAMMFVAFSAWDVVAGDRAELLEHGTYLGVVFITAAFVALTQFKPFVSATPAAATRARLSISS